MVGKRSTRPRDALGRPLAPDAVGVEPVPESALPPDDALTFAQQLLDEGRAFSAHEVLEAVWKACPPGERDLWQGLAQLCVAVTHHERGNAAGALTLRERGAGRLREYGGPLHDVDLEGVLHWATGDDWTALRLRSS